MYSDYRGGKGAYFSRPGPARPGPLQAHRAGKFRPGPRGSARSLPPLIAVDNNSLGVQFIEDKIMVKRRTVSGTASPQRLNAIEASTGYSFVYEFVPVNTPHYSKS